MIAREGLPFILISLIATLLFLWAATRYDSRWFLTVAVIFAIVTLFTTFFFRDPNRSFTPESEVLIAPADGKVIRIDRGTSNSFIGGGYVKVSIFLSIFDVHVNRVPATGTVDYVKYNPGKFFAAFQDKASDLNEQTEIGMTTTQGRKLIFKQIAGLIARRIVCRLQPGDAVDAGGRFGMIRFGSRTELFVPDDSELKVKVGDRVAGGSTIIGYLKSPVDSGNTTSVESTREQL